MLSLLQHSHATWNIIWSIFSDFLFNTKAFVLQAHDEQDKEHEGRTGGKTPQNIGSINKISVVVGLISPYSCLDVLQVPFQFQKKWPQVLQVWFLVLCLFLLSVHQPLHIVWKLQKKSHSILRAKRATFTFWNELKKRSNLAIFWKNDSFNRTKIGGKCQN